MHPCLYRYCRQTAVHFANRTPRGVEAYFFINYVNIFAIIDFIFAAPPERWNQSYIKIDYYAHLGLKSCTCTMLLFNKVDSINFQNHFQTFGDRSFISPNVFLMTPPSCVRLCSSAVNWSTPFGDVASLCFARICWLRLTVVVKVSK